LNDPKIPREHPAYPAFKRWADENFPGQMLSVYWACWLAGGAYALTNARDTALKMAKEVEDRNAQAAVERQAAALQDRPRPDIVPREVAPLFIVPCGKGPMPQDCMETHVRDCPVCRDEMDRVLASPKPLPQIGGP
jgi:hypothetical protein